MIKYLFVTLQYIFLSICSLAQNPNDIYNTCIPQLDTLDGLEVFRITEKIPAYLGGMSEFYKEIFKNLVIPKETMRTSIVDRVVFTFVIDTLGNLRNLCFIKPENAYIEEKIIRAINQEKKWISAEHKNQKVPYRFMIQRYINLR